MEVEISYSMEVQLIILNLMLVQLLLILKLILKIRLEVDKYYLIYYQVVQISTVSVSIQIA